jgi:hypothetical protein
MSPAAPRNASHMPRQKLAMAKPHPGSCLWRPVPDAFGIRAAPRCAPARHCARLCLAGRKRAVKWSNPLDVTRYVLVVRGQSGAVSCVPHSPTHLSTETPIALWAYDGHPRRTARLAPYGDETRSLKFVQRPRFGVSVHPERRDLCIRQPKRLRLYGPGQLRLWPCWAAWRQSRYMSTTPAPSETCQCSG